MRDPAPKSEDMSGGLNQNRPEPDGADLCIGRLKRRADFLRAAKGRRWHGKPFSLQAAVSPQEFRTGAAVPLAPRIGFTVTKKVGGSVVRNRARRRLREAVRLATGLAVELAHDYVLVARIEAVRLPFETLKTDLSRAFRSVHSEARPRDAKRRNDKPSHRDG